MVWSPAMDIEIEFEPELEPIELDSLKNEFTGALRESTKPPGIDEPICLISYEITYILLGDGPGSRPSFWKMYRRELELNKKTDYQNYHVHVCRNQLSSLKMNLNQPVYFRNNRLTTEKELDPFTTKALAAPRFS
jgi:hypothetical protein